MPKYITLRRKSTSSNSHSTSFSKLVAFQATAPYTKFGLAVFGPTVNLPPSSLTSTSMRRGCHSPFTIGLRTRDSSPWF